MARGAGELEKEAHVKTTPVLNPDAVPLTAAELDDIATRTRWAGEDSDPAKLLREIQRMRDVVWCAEANADGAAHMQWEYHKKLVDMLTILKDRRLSSLLQVVLSAQEHVKHVDNCPECRSQKFDAMKFRLKLKDAGMLEDEE